MESRELESGFIKQESSIVEQKKLELRERLVKIEKQRLQELYKNIPENQKKLTEGLIIQAARLRILLDEMWIDITENGDYVLSVSL